MNFGLVGSFSCNLAYQWSLVFYVKDAQAAVSVRCLHGRMQRWALCRGGDAGGIIWASIVV